MPPTIVGGFGGRPAYRLGPPPPHLADFPLPPGGGGRRPGIGGNRARLPDKPVMPPQRTRQVFVAYSYALYPKADYRAVFAAVGRAYRVQFVFADERITNPRIAAKTRNHIQASDFSLFDVSGWNANVAFELGMAHEMTGVDWYICFNPDKGPKEEVPGDIRGLDRVQYRSFAELREKLTALLERWYPPDPGGTLDDFAEKMKAEIVALLRDHPDGLAIGRIAAGARVNREMAQVAVRQLKAAGKIIQSGKRFHARYRLKKTNGAAV